MNASSSFGSTMMLHNRGCLESCHHNCPFIIPDYNHRHRYVVNTKVDRPHDSGKVLSLKMGINTDVVPTCITTGEDNKFRVWSASMSSGEDDGACFMFSGDSSCLNIKPIVRWSCRSIGMYKSDTPTDACISPDGSLIAVAEKHVRRVTL